MGPADMPPSEPSEIRSEDAPRADACPSVQRFVSAIPLDRLPTIGERLDQIRWKGTYASAEADVEAGARMTCSKRPPEVIWMFGELTALILLAGAFTLLSSNPDTFKGPVKNFLLSDMAVGFLSSCIWLLTRARHREMRGVSSFLQWSAISSVFVAFSLIMIHLIIR